MEEKKFRNAVSFIAFAASCKGLTIDYYKNPKTSNITALFCNAKTKDVVKAVYCSHAATQDFLAEKFEKLQVVEAQTQEGDWMLVICPNKMSEHRKSLTTIVLDD